MGGCIQVVVKFMEPAWFINVVSAEDTVGLDIGGVAGELEHVRRLLGFPGESLAWRSGGLQRLVIQSEVIVDALLDHGDSLDYYSHGLQQVMVMKRVRDQELQHTITGRRQADWIVTAKDDKA